MNGYEICEYGRACWIPGTGFRVVENWSMSCGISDAPFNGKLTPAFSTEGKDPLEVLRFIFPGSTEQTTAATVHVAPVPLAGSFDLLGGALVIAALFRFLPRAVSGMEKVRGKKKSGWA